MFRELLTIFRAGNPLKAMADNFADMLRLAYELTIKAGEMYITKSASADERTRVYKQDVKINKLQRTIRKQVAAHLALNPESPNVPYCLLIMSLVKDVERIGDYAKNVAEVVDICPDPLPDDERVAEIKEIKAGVEATFHAATIVFGTANHDEAIELIHEGKDLAHRCDALVASVARSSYTASLATDLVLSTRFYKRIGAHVLNILSSVVMPLHKLDYYDEDEVPNGLESPDDA